MYEILSFLYEFFAEFLPFLLTLYLFRRGRGKFAQRPPAGAYVLPILFALYTIAVFHVTGAGTIYDAFYYDLPQLLGRVHLIPFSEAISVRGYVLNAVMFVPFGLLVPLTWRELRRPGRTILAGLAFSLLIELSQLVTLRATDVDDLIMNTLGAGVGWVAYWAWSRLSRCRFQQSLPAARELPVYVLALFLGRFFLFNQRGLIGLIYGY